MAYKTSVVLGPIDFNSSGVVTTAIGSGTNSGTITLGNTSSGAVTINSGVAGITLGTTANAHSTTVGSTSSTSSSTLQSGSGALNVTSTDGALTINSGTGTLAISNDASATTVNVATGGAAKAATFGSITTTSATTVACGTGVCNLGSSATDHTTTVGSVIGVSPTTLQGGSGALNVTSTGGALTINSGAGVLAISNDASATTVNIATGASPKTTTLGSTDTTSGTTINSGSNGITLIGVAAYSVGSVADIVSINTGTGRIGRTTITAGSGVSVTPGANTVTIAATAPGFAWGLATVDANIVANNGYIANKAGLLTMTLPATAAIGDLAGITGINTAVGWRIAQNANQQIFFGTSSTTVGVGGYIEATAIRDTVQLVCVVAGASTVWNVISSQGNITIM